MYPASCKKMKWENIPLYYQKIEHSKEMTSFPHNGKHQQDPAKTSEDKEINQKLKHKISKSVTLTSRSMMWVKMVQQKNFRPVSNIRQNIN